jgi:hypothetical protein
MEEIKMNKTLMISLFAMLALLMINSVSAATPNMAPYANGVAYGYASYGAYPVNPAMTQTVYSYPQTPVRVGGFYGQNSAFLIGLRPGYYDGPVMNTYSRYALSSAYYPKARNSLRRNRQ